MSMRQVIALAAMNACVIAACAGSGTGRTQQQAVSVAKPIAQAMSSTPVVFASATSGSFGSFEPNVGASVSEPDREVWTIVLQGTFHGSCGPAAPTPRACPPPNTTVRVILDYTTGAFIMAATPAGQG